MSQPPHTNKVFCGGISFSSHSGLFFQEQDSDHIHRFIGTSRFWIVFVSTERLSDICVFII